MPQFFTDSSVTIHIESSGRGSVITLLLLGLAVPSEMHALNVHSTGSFHVIAFLLSLVRTDAITVHSP